MRTVVVGRKDRDAMTHAGMPTFRSQGAPFFRLRLKVICRWRKGLHHHECGLVAVSGRVKRTIVGVVTWKVHLIQGNPPCSTALDST